MPPGVPLPSRRPLGRRLIVGPERSRAEIRALICSAKHSIRILDHKLSDPDLVALLRERRAEGITVSVLGKQPMRGVVPHGKMMIIDETRAVLGSTALSTLSLDFRREVSVVVHEPALVKQLNMSYQQLSGEGRRRGHALAGRPNRMKRLLIVASILLALAPSSRAAAQDKQRASSGTIARRSCSARTSASTCKGRALLEWRALRSGDRRRHVSPPHRAHWPAGRADQALRLGDRARDRRDRREVAVRRVERRLARVEHLRRRLGHRRPLQDAVRPRADHRRQRLWTSPIARSARRRSRPAAIAA